MNKYNKSGEFNEYKINKLKDPDFAKGYLETALEEFYKDNDYAAFLNAIKDIAIAQKGMTKLSKETGKNRQSLYISLSKKGNPTFLTLSNVLNNLGYKLSIKEYK